MQTISSSHWMLREIQEQPLTIAVTLRHYMGGDGSLRHATLDIEKWLVSCKSLLVLASGSSRHAGLFLAQLVRSQSTLPIDVEYASEYGVTNGHAPDPATGVIVISQSGETADTLAALREGRRRGHATLAVTNVAGSSMAKEADVFLPVLAGKEVAIPATKSFTSQLIVMGVLGLVASRSFPLPARGRFLHQVSELYALPQQIEIQLPLWATLMEKIAQRYAHAETFIVLGRGPHLAIAEEGALKLRESAYIPAIALASGELKHGPNALVNESALLIFLATVDVHDEASKERYGKTLQLLRDMRAQGAPIVSIGNEGDDAVCSLSTEFISIRSGSEMTQAMSEVIPLQLLSYFLSVERGIDVDRH